MKIRKAARAIVLIVFLTALWCVTPTGNEIPQVAAIKIAISFIGIFLCFLVRPFPTDEACNFFHNITDAIHKKLIQLKNFIDNTIERFLSWSCDATLKEISNTRTKHKEGCNNAWQAKEQALTLPIRRIARRIDLVCIIAFLTFLPLGVQYCHYQNIAALIILFLIYLTFVHTIGFIIHATSFDGPFFASVEPATGIICIYVHAFINVIQLIMAVANKFKHIEIVSDYPYLPYYTLQLRFISFSLTPLEADAIIGGCFLLLAYSSLCSSLHQLARPSKPITY